MTRCDMTDLLVEQCAHCRPDEDNEPPVIEGRSRARFNSPCPGCEHRICEGDEIYLVDDQWVCWRCTQ